MCFKRFLEDTRVGALLRMYSIYFDLGARCSSVVRAFAYGAMGRRIDPS